MKKVCAIVLLIASGWSAFAGELSPAADTKSERTAAPAPGVENRRVFNLQSEAAWPGEVDGPSRTWTPANSGDHAPGILHGPPFSARLRGVFNEETRFSHEFAIFDLADGRVQGYETRSFIPADREFLHGFAQTMPAARAEVADEYHAAPSDETRDLFDRQQIDRYLSPHFAFWFGHAGKGDDARLLGNPKFLPEGAVWYEKIWRHFAVEAGAPMPCATLHERSKINVVLSDSGYPGATGYASSAEAMGLQPIAMQYGSSVVAHEFTHVIQYYSGGFRESPTVGYFWETHANFGAFTYQPTETHDLGQFFAHLECGVQWSEPRYSNWPFLMHLYEKKATRPLVFDIWTKNRRDAQGHTLEDPMETLVRLGQETGLLPRGWESLADEWGELAERLVTWDYIHHTYYDPATRADREKARVHLAGNGPGYDSPRDRPLRAYGIHFIHLHPTRPQAPVTVELTGGCETQQAAWRFGLVAADAGSNVRYSRVCGVEGTSAAKAELTIQDGDDVTLVVAATPYRYVPVPWDQLPPNPFPYTVVVTNAVPD